MCTSLPAQFWESIRTWPRHMKQRKNLRKSSSKNLDANLVEMRNLTRKMQEMDYPIPKFTTILVKIHYYLKISPRSKGKTNRAPMRQERKNNFHSEKSCDLWSYCRATKNWAQFFTNSGLYALNDRSKQNVLPENHLPVEKQSKVC